MYGIVYSLFNNCMWNRYSSIYDTINELKMAFPK